MSEWVFETEAEAIAAAADCASALDADILLTTGAIATIQVTERWAIPEPTIDGRWMFLAMPGRSTPAGGLLISDEDALALRPKPDLDLFRSP